MPTSGVFRSDTGFVVQKATLSRMKRLVPKISRPVRNLALLCCVFAAGVCLYPLVSEQYQLYWKPHLCGENQRHLAQGILMYAQDYDEHLPIAGKWMDASSPYVGNKLDFRCPGVVRRHQEGFGYGFNSDLSSRAVPTIKNPSMTPLIYDSEDRRWNATGPGLREEADARRHSYHHIGKNFYTFLDGHVSPYRSGKPPQRKHK